MGFASFQAAHRRLILLLAIGLAAEIVYLVFFTWRFPLPERYASLTDIGGWTNHSPIGFAIFLASVLVQFALFWLAYVLVRKEADRYLVAIVAGFGVVFAVTLVFMYPVTATDMYGYLVRSRIFTIFGENLFVTVPSQVPQDPFTSHIGVWKDWPTPYGPLFILLGAPLSFFGANNLLLVLLLFKGLAIRSYLGNIVLIYLIVRRLSPGSAASGVLFYAWNPLC